MSYTIRKVTYTVNYVHVLTFRNQYPQIVTAYFDHKGLRYAIDNESSINESIRLIFGDEFLSIQCRKDSISFVYEGDPVALKKASGIIQPFFNLLEGIKGMDGFHRTTKHSLTLVAVNILNEDIAKKQFNENQGFPIKFNPYGKLEEFGCVFEFKKEIDYHKVQFGNFNQNDIKKWDVSPFKNPYNNDLKTNSGLMCIAESSGDCAKATYTNFKEYLENSDALVKKLNDYVYEQ